VDVTGIVPGAEATYEVRAVASNVDLSISDDVPESSQVVIDHLSPSSGLLMPATNSVLPIGPLFVLQATSQQSDTAGVLFEYKPTGSPTWSEIGNAEGHGTY